MTYIDMQPITDLCEEAVQRPGTRVSKRRWEQEGLELAGAWEAAALEGEPGMAAGVVGGG